MLSATPFAALKPLIPRRVQIIIRRMLINWNLSSCKNTWPIDPASATPPVVWHGWPEGKKFAPIYLPYIWSHHSLKYKAKSAYHITRNILSGMTENKDLLLVAGRPANASLVGTVARNVREFSGLATREITVSDCA